MSCTDQICIEANIEESGPPGASAYEIWLSQPGNGGKTIAEFLESLKGDVGDVNPLMPGILADARDARDEASESAATANAAAESATTSAETFAINFASMATSLIRTQAVVATHHAFA
jgi:hypothetical protein